MAEKINTYCSICGKGYYVCNSCNEFMRLSPWKIHTDTAEHYKIYQIIHGLSTNVYSKAEAKEKLANVDLSDLEDLRENIKAIIKDILNNDKEKDIQNTENANKTENNVTIKRKRNKQKFVE